ncbi:MAG: SAP domain-containing protein [Candidatus Thorarchaeota archaeon]
MKNIDILNQYNKSDLRRLAKGKISEIVGIDSDKILTNLSRVLGNYESIRNNIEFRKPPVHTILEVIFETPKHSVKYEDLKPQVKKKIEEYQKMANEINLDDPGKGYRLYANVLNAAWEYESDLLPAEANILRVLRKELNISRKEHQYIMAHKEINRLTYKEETYQRELEFLNQEGIILVYNKDNESYLVLSDETADSLKELWGIELEPEQYIRLLKKLNKSQLAKTLKSFKLPSSGTNEDLISRIISNEIKPSELLNLLSSSELSNYMKTLNLSTSGKKEEKILKIKDYFENDRDLIVPESKKEEKEPEFECKILSEEKRIDFLSTFSIRQLNNTLRKLKLSKSGSKNTLIERLANCHFNENTILDSFTVGDLSELNKRLGLRSSGVKSELIDNIINHFQEITIKESNLSTKQLMDFYSELSCQDRRIYSQDNTCSEINTSIIAMDFERVTKYLFKNILKLETKTQKFGHEEPDGIIKDDEGNIFLYECKTTLNPPYDLPISHRRQIKNYIENIANSKDKNSFKGYIIISHSFLDKIEDKINEIKPLLDVPISVIEAKDLVAFAKKWEMDYPTDTFPIKNIIKKGRIKLSDFEKVLH